MESHLSTDLNAKFTESPSGQVAEQTFDTAELTATIARRIRRQTASRIHDLAVECNHGSIVLRGRCSTFYTKQLAGHAAMGVLEGETLSNQIEVALP